MLAGGKRLSPTGADSGDKVPRNEADEVFNVENPEGIFFFYILFTANKPALSQYLYTASAWFVHSDQFFLFLRM